MASVLAMVGVEAGLRVASARTRALVAASPNACWTPSYAAVHSRVSRTGRPTVRADSSRARAARISATAWAGDGVESICSQSPLRVLQFRALGRLVSSQEGGDRRGRGGLRTEGPYLE